MAFPIIGGLAKADYKIGLMIKENIAGIGQLLPQVDKIYPVDSGGRLEQKALAKIKDDGYETALVLPNSFRSAWQIWRTGIKRRIGHGGNFRSILLTDPIAKPEPHNLHQSDYYNRIAKTVSGFAPAMPQLFVSDTATATAGRLLPKTDNPIVGIGFGATYGSAKMWPPENFAELIDQISRFAQVVLVGAESDRNVCAEVLKSSEKSGEVIDLVGKSDLPTLCALMKKFDCYLTNDTGPMHLADMLNVPTVAIFGPTSIKETAPLSENVAVISANTDCAPCFKRECPTDHLCMTRIKTAEVELAVRKAIGR
jgi:heptosyltransferase-2